MKKSIFASGKSGFAKTSLVGILLFVIIAVMIIVGLSRANASTSSESGKLLQDTLSRAAMRCYATEGFYPDSIDYLKENYGVIVSDRYIVEYNVFAVNIMPNIIVHDVNMPAEEEILEEDFEDDFFEFEEE